ncbi:hypothetical protein PHYSODRAFT_259988 [Phytophthora sojae]|uniref:Uncharacterized protein n=1 Tax=Phytophthora sojae (strain P6497) TaxID=1094619 RepID=G4ZKA3_PHYSP|nr:hypothetical protein PHYSODRAFT_259988 [Phytophthora sojae]EGZ15220.1 hypothetical protein PHYSODRAFT_259988 [Phytophthora sojae]|eukprot:XP_009528969.1 hypothetical protein PHYSODRAFT_259988 [Phytophthora sojae]
MGLWGVSTRTSKRRGAAISRRLYLPALGGSPGTSEKTGDLVGAATCSVGHLYHILFTVMCLQSAKSLKAYAIVIAVNTLQMLLNCRGILQNADEIRRTFEALPELPGHEAVTSALTIAQQENVSKLLHRKRLSRRQVYESQSDLTRQQELYVRQVTSALHQTEIVLLRSYITIFVLPFYGLYQALIFSLPNRRFFVTMATTATFDAVASMIFHMLVLCTLELLVLAMCMILISHRLGSSGLQQLAFVLWSQRILIQGKSFTSCRDLAR